MINKIEKCTGCGACRDICPKGCITMQIDEDGFVYPKINQKLCINCGLCDYSCPLNMKKIITEEEQEVYAAINMVDHIRMKSSSGGIFSLIASYVIGCGGVVYGASFSEDFTKVQHISVTKEEDLECLLGAKYLQSDLQNSFCEIKQLLIENRMVLFSGTPCQVAGLKSYLQKEYSNLFTMDFICHGVPSSKMWKNFLKTIINDDKKIKGIYFRNKSTGWKKYSMLIKYVDDTTRIIDTAKNSYMIGFIEGIYLRKSCYVCPFKHKNYYSDITVGDFWGIEKILPEMHDDRGASVVVINTKKGNKMFHNIEKIKYQRVDLNLAMRSNPSFYRNQTSMKSRKYIMKQLNKKDINQVVFEYYGKTLKAKIRRKINKLLDNLSWK